MLLIIKFIFSFNEGLTLHKAQHLRRPFVGATRSIQGNCCPYHSRPVLNVRIKPSLWTTDVLTSQTNLNILNWAILPCKLQYNTRNQKGKGKLLWDCFYLKVKSQKGGLPAGQLGMFFLSPEDESRSPGTGRYCSTALKIPNCNFILKRNFCGSIQV